MTVHAAAMTGFDRGGDAYQAGRPEYPAKAVNCLIEHLRLTPGDRILEIGAGTGKFTKRLLEAGLPVVAVEPVPGMRAKFHELFPGTEILDGTAEQIPAASNSVAALIAAQAFHWFDGGKALAEFARVLKPQGGVGLIWNVREESVDWMAKLTEIIDVHEGNAPRYRTGNWKQAFATSEVFTPLEQSSFFHVQQGTPATLVNRVLSISFISALPDNERQMAEREVLQLIERHPALSGRSILEIPYRTDVFWCQRK